MITVEMMMHSPFGHEMMGLDDDEGMMAIHQLVRSMDRLLPVHPRRKPTAKPEEKKP